MAKKISDIEDDDEDEDDEDSEEETTPDIRSQAGRDLDAEYEAYLEKKKKLLQEREGELSSKKAMLGATAKKPEEKPAEKKDKEESEGIVMVRIPTDFSPGFKLPNGDVVDQLGLLVHIANEVNDLKRKI